MDVTIDAVDVPVSSDSDWLPGLAAGKVVAVTMYEDPWRDDVDGPPRASSQGTCHTLRGDSCASRGQIAEFRSSRC